MKPSKYLFLCFSLFTFHFSFSQGLDSIRYHDGSFESQWGGSGYNTDEFGCFVRFTPNFYPDTLMGIEAYFRNGADTSKIRFKVYFDTAGLAMGGVTPKYISPVFNNPSSTGNANQAYNLYKDVSTSNIVVMKGDVYVGVVEHNNTFFGIGIDTNGNNYIDRQWEWYNVFSNNYWSTMSSNLGFGQLGITAYFSPQVSTGLKVINDEKYNIYLSPADNILHINIYSFSDNPVLRVFDPAGKQIIDNKLRDFSTNINMSNYNAGLYLVNIISDKSYYSYKLIKL